MGGTPPAKQKDFGGQGVKGQRGSHGTGLVAAERRPRTSAPRKGKRQNKQVEQPRGAVDELVNTQTSFGDPEKKTLLFLIGRIERTRGNR